MKVGLFIPCYINAVYPEVGIASYKLLKHVGVDVDYPMDQTLFYNPMANINATNDKTNRNVWRNSLRTMTTW